MNFNRNFRINHTRNNINKRRFNNRKYINNTTQRRQRYIRNTITRQNKNKINRFLPRDNIINKQRSARKNDNNMNNNRKLNKINNQLREVTNKLDDMTIKSTNLIVNKKELRNDRLISPYTMARRGQYIPIYEIKEKVLNMSVYTKISLTLNASTDDIRYTLVFFPYSINFKSELYSFYNINNRINTLGGAADHFKNVYFYAENLTSNTYTAAYEETSDSGIIGNWKLIGSTMKIYNTSSMINKGGDYSIIKIQDNEMYPMFIHKGSQIDRQASDFIRSKINQDYSQAPRNNFSASDTAFIDEYNVLPGTNIFSDPHEYLGCRYTTSEHNTANFSTDLVGNNIVYLFQTKSVSTSQSYVFEIWNVFSIIPCPNSGLGNLGAISKRSFTKGVVDSIKDRPSMYKANK